jgi:hypothetical protein
MTTLIKRTKDVINYSDYSTVGFQCAYGTLSNDMITAISYHFDEYKDKPETEEYLKLCFYNARAFMQVNNFTEALKFLELIEKREPYWIDASIMQFSILVCLGRDDEAMKIPERYEKINQKKLFIKPE